MKNTNVQCEKKPGDFIRSLRKHIIREKKTRIEIKILAIISEKHRNVPFDYNYDMGNPICNL